jgi:hypothetical protein
LPPPAPPASLFSVRIGLAVTPRRKTHTKSTRKIPLEPRAKTQSVVVADLDADTDAGSSQIVEVSLTNLGLLQNFRKLAAKVARRVGLTEDCEKDVFAGDLS